MLITRKPILAELKMVLIHFRLAVSTLSLTCCVMDGNELSVISRQSSSAFCSRVYSRLPRFSCHNTSINCYFKASDSDHKTSLLSHQVSCFISMPHIDYVSHSNTNSNSSKYIYQHIWKHRRSFTFKFKGAKAVGSGRRLYQGPKRQERR